VGTISIVAFLAPSQKGAHKPFYWRAYPSKCQCGTLQPHTRIRLSFTKTVFLGVRLWLPPDPSRPPNVLDPLSSGVDEQGMIRRSTYSPVGEYGRLIVGEAFPTSVQMSRGCKPHVCDTLLYHRGCNTSGGVDPGSILMSKYRHQMASDFWNIRRVFPTVNTL